VRGVDPRREMAFRRWPFISMLLMQVQHGGGEEVGKQDPSSARYDEY